MNDFELYSDQSINTLDNLTYLSSHTPVGIAFPNTLSQEPK